MNYKKKLWYFNPDCELAVFKEQIHYSPPKMIKTLRQELALLMMWLADHDDYVYVENLFEETNWLSVIRSVIGFKVNIVNADLIKKNNLKFTELKPWGSAPNIYSSLSSIENRIDKKLAWEGEMRNYFHRSTGYKITKHLAAFSKEGLVRESELGDFYNSLEAVKVAIDTIFNAGFKGVILKLPFSSSGRGNLILKRNELTLNVRKWIDSGIAKQGSILIEPLLQKENDFSLLFEKKNNDVVFLGGTSFLVGDTGQYFGASLNGFNKLFSPQESKLIEWVIDQLKVEFKKWTSFQGQLGVDAMTYINKDGKKKIQPCIEVNPRYTMGHITLEIEKKIAKNKKGKWRIVTKQDIADFLTFKTKMEKKHPLKIINGKVEAGFLPLVDVSQVTNYYVYLIINDEEV